MKRISITITDYNSKFFPVKISWNINRQVYTNVFETREAALNYITALFLNPFIKDKSESR